MNETTSLIRFNNLIIATIAILETAYLSQIELSFQIIFLIIVIISFMASGYITNDLLDYETDLINAKKRPLIIKSITKKKAKQINLCMIFFGVLFSFREYRKSSRGSFRQRIFPTKDLSIILSK